MGERHCADARYLWNLAVEQFRYRERKERGTTCRPAPGPAARQKQLAEARQEFEWLRGGSSSVQQQALRDFDRAAQACFDGYAGEPTWRKRGQSEGFCIRDKVQQPRVPQVWPHGEGEPQEPSGVPLPRVRPRRPRAPQRCGNNPRPG